MPPSRTQTLTAAATLAAVFLVVFGPGVLTGLQVVAGHAAPRPSSAWTDRVAGLEWDVFSVAVVVLVVVRWLPRHAAEVAMRMQLSRPPTFLRLAAAAAAYVGVAALATRLGAAAVAAAHLPSAPYSRLAGGVGGFLTTAAAATAAGVTEEVTLVALAAAVAAQLCQGRARWALPATLALLIGLRLLVHAYYLWGSAFVLLWVPGAYVVYRWAASVWPLVIGHWIYDWLALTATQFRSTAPAVTVVLWLLGGCGVVAMATTWRRAARPSSCSEPSSACPPTPRATASARAWSRSSAPG